LSFFVCIWWQCYLLIDIKDFYQLPLQILFFEVSLSLDSHLFLLALRFQKFSNFLKGWKQDPFSLNTIFKNFFIRLFKMSSLCILRWLKEDYFYLALGRVKNSLIILTLLILSCNPIWKNCICIFHLLFHHFSIKLTSFLILHIYLEGYVVTMSSRFISSQLKTSQSKNLYSPTFPMKL